MAYEFLATQDEHWQRALDVHRQLARASRLREVGLPDLLIAAAAERHRVMLLHYDDDFDTIGRITEQEVAWVVGSWLHSVADELPDVVHGSVPLESAGMPWGAPAGKPSDGSARNTPPRIRPTPKAPTSTGPQVPAALRRG